GGGGVGGRGRRRGRGGGGGGVGGGGGEGGDGRRGGGGGGGRGGGGALLRGRRAGGEGEGDGDEGGDEGSAVDGPTGRGHQSSFRAWIRSSSGGWVSNSRLSLARRPSAALRASGDSIQRWAVAREPECTTVVSSFSFSSAATRPG